MELCVHHGKYLRGRWRTELLTHLETDTRLLPVLCKHHLVYISEPSALDDEPAPLQVLQAQGYITSPLLIHCTSDKCPERKLHEPCVFLNQLIDGLSVLQNSNDSSFLQLYALHISLCSKAALCMFPAHRLQQALQYKLWLGTHCPGNIPFIFPANSDLKHFKLRDRTLKKGAE